MIVGCVTIFMYHQHQIIFYLVTKYEQRWQNKIIFSPNWKWATHLGVCVCIVSDPSVICFNGVGGGGGLFLFSTFRYVSILLTSEKMAKANINNRILFVSVHHPNLVQDSIDTLAKLPRSHATNECWTHNTFFYPYHCDVISASTLLAYTTLYSVHIARMG